MFGRVIYDRQNVYLDGCQVTGVTNFTSSITLPVKPISIVGTGYIVPDLDGEIGSTFSFTMICPSQEPDILAKIDQEVTGIFAYNADYVSTDKRWVAAHSILSSYEFTCAVGNIPSASYTYEAMGQAGTFNDGSTVTKENITGIDIVRPGDLTLSGNNLFVTNRIQDLAYRFSIPWTFRNFMGSGFRRFASLSQIIPVEVDFSLDIDDVTSGVATTGLCDQNFNGKFIFDKCGTTLRTFSISGAELTSFSIDASVGPNATAKISYRGYVNDIATLKDRSY